MKKNVFKIIISLVFIFAVVGGFSAINFNCTKNVKAEETLKYVALGDSIADGTGLPGYQKYTFVEGAYTTLLKEDLETRFNIDAVTYAKASSNTSDLLSLLNGMPTEKYSDLDVETALNDIASADLITLCIGANDILLPAIENVYDFIMNNKTVADMEQILDKGLEAFTSNYPEVLKKLTELNPNAQIIVHDIYNPYKYFKLTAEIEKIAPYVGVNVNNANSIGDITEIYLDGGTNSSGNKVSGLNNILTSSVAMNNNGNITITFIKTNFDSCVDYDISYSELVNADPTKITAQNFMNFSEYADPHPTLEGHEMIASSVIFAAEDVEPVTPPTNPDEPESENVTVSFVPYGGHLTDEMGNVFNKKTIEKGSKIVNYVPVKAESPFGGWYIDSAFTTKWNFDDEVTEDITLFAKWISLTCENSQNKNQDITNLKEVHFSLNIEDVSNYSIAWYVESEEKLQLVEGESGTTFTFLPTKSGTFKIKAQVNGVMTKVVDVIITRSRVSKVTIALKQKDVNNNFVIEIMDNTYSDNELVWYKSSTEYESEVEMICKGKSILNYQFDSNCTIWVEYVEDGSIISNKLDIVVGNNAPTDIIVGVLVGVLIIGAFITAVILTKRKYSDY